MRQKLKQLTDAQLIELATELRQSSIPDDALIRTLIPNGNVPVLTIIEITSHLAQELADRLCVHIKPGLIGN